MSAKYCFKVSCSEDEKSLMKTGKEMDTTTKTTCLQLADELDPGLEKSPFAQGTGANIPPRQYDAAGHNKHSSATNW